MTTSKPFEGRKVFIPRGQKQSGAFSKLVKKYGGEPTEIPLIEFQPVNDKGLRDAIQNLASYDWVIFTSKVTVEIFFSLVDETVSVPKIAVIGGKTEETIRKLGYHVDFLPHEYVAEGFIREFLPIVSKKAKILLPKGNLARDYIPNQLRTSERMVEELVVYETVFPEESKRMLRNLLEHGTMDILAFTSPSTIENFMSIVNQYQLHKSLKGVIIVCIGPVAKKKAEAFGLTVNVVPDVYTVEEMVNSLIAYLSHTSKNMEEEKI
ncbi:uroporphyrinogen-III synthase [Cytobacillus sp. Hz8]|uniref:uroporphyrinogen-III synthase n=1 Tax=Cytobacillus sp. Hz8 TaxID=3347168 RepID=UPI0035DB54EE